MRLPAIIFVVLREERLKLQLLVPVHGTLFWMIPPPHSKREHMQQILNSCGIDKMKFLVLVSLLIEALVPVNCWVSIDKSLVSMKFEASSTRLHNMRQRNSGFNDDDEQLASWDREVRAGAQARVDMQRVRKLLDAQNDEGLDADQSVLFAPQWQVSLAAAACTGLITSTTFHSTFLAIVSSGFVFYVAISDPSDGISGALARSLGRVTLKGVESSKPKIRAMARAAITNEEEISILKNEIARLQQENNELRRWRARKLAVDSAMPNYSLEELKDLARQSGLPIGGNKSDILMRLAEADVIKFL